jgi:hypothetical protein
MTAEVFSKGVVAIESLFNSGTYPLNAADDIWPDVRDFSDDAMRGAYRRIRIEFNSRPTLARVRDLIVEEGRKIASKISDEIEREAEQRRREEAQHTNVVLRGAAGPDPFIREMCRIALGGYTEERRAELMADVERRYPGLPGPNGEIVIDAWEKARRIQLRGRVMTQRDEVAV